MFLGWQADEKEVVWSGRFYLGVTDKTVWLDIIEAPSEFIGSTSASHKTDQKATEEQSHRSGRNGGEGSQFRDHPLCT